MRRALLVVIAVMGAGCTDLLAPAPTAPTTVTVPPLPWTLKLSGCHEFFLNANVPLGEIAQMVPRNYTILGAGGGRATLAIGVATCDAWAYDNDTPEAVAISDVGVFLESPDGTPGTHVYQLWREVNSTRERARMDAAGIPGNVTGLNLTQGARTPGADAHAEVAGAYRLTGTSVAPVAPVQLGITWWRTSENGTVRIHYEFAGDTSVARASVLATSGTPMAKLVGAGAEGAAFLPAFGGTGAFEKR